MATLLRFYIKQTSFMATLLHKNWNQIIWKLGSALKFGIKLQNQSELTTTLFTEIFCGTCKIAPKIVMIELNEIQRKERIKKHLLGGV